MLQALSTYVICDGDDDMGPRELAWHDMHLLLDAYMCIVSP